MKNLVVLILTTCSLYAADLRTNLLLVCNYPTNLTGTTIQFFGTNDVNAPLNTWPLIGSTFQNTQLVVTVKPGLFFYVANASNVVGVSDFSGIAVQPVPPRSDVILQLK